MKFRTLLLLGNVIFWMYFWTSFAFASQPTEQAFFMDHPLDPYIFWGHEIGFGYNPFALPFMKMMVCVELPSFFLATLLQNLLTGEPAGRLLVRVFGYFGDKLLPGSYPNQFGGVQFLGISINGYHLLATMILSLLQWYLIGWAIQSFWYKCFGQPLSKSG